MKPQLVEPPIQLIRAGLIGDVHAEDSLLEVALDYLASNAVDAVLCTGDVPDGPGSVTRCCELLIQRDVLMVRGNHERWFLSGGMPGLTNATDPRDIPAETREYLANLPPTIEFSTPMGGLLLCHGLGSNDMAIVQPEHFGYALENNFELQELIRDPRYRFVVNGHSHRAMVRHFPGLTVINAGTLECDRGGFLLADFSQREVRMFQFGAGREIFLKSIEVLQ